VSSGAVAAARRVKIPSAGLPANLVAGPKGDALLQQKYRNLARQHLDIFLNKLFAAVTGLHFHIAWAPAPAHGWEDTALPSGCSACCRISGSPLLIDCQSCGAKQLARALRADGDGHHFTCRLGVRNYWFALRIRNETLGIAYLQALDRAIARQPARKNSARVVRHRPFQQDARVLNQSRFVRAARLLRLIVQYVQTASLADLRKTELTNARWALLALEKERARLQHASHDHLPDSSQSLHRSDRETHPEQIVHRLLARLELDYAKPVTLQHYARELRVNAAYLSDLFSHALGIPFKTLLTSMRMAKAKQLLDDPATNVSQVASAVGYASENRFRFAFKKATGLAPKLWRETMQTTPAAS
jgi:AraC-like DNA-binding protein